MTQSPTVLIVDDDPYGLSFFRSSLKLSGFRVVTALSVREAQERVTEMGPDSFDAILTDFRMPELTGLDLLTWIRRKDPTLGTVLITAQGEKDLIKRSLSEGACDFLEKPVTHEVLRDTLKKAVTQTGRMRKFESDQVELRDVGRMDRTLNTYIEDTLSGQVEVFYRPLHEIGGDFLSAVRLGERKFGLLVGDVTGHDLQAGFLSVYLNGLARGTNAAGQPLEAAMDLINRSLFEQRQKASSEKLSPSVAATTVTVDLDEEALFVANNGFPPPLLVDETGFVRSTGFGGFPLGWSREQPARPERVELGRTRCVLFHSDGLVEAAEELKINLFSLIYRLTSSKDKAAYFDFPAEDDILLINLKILPTLHNGVQTTLIPIVHESYTGDECENIDHLQSVWRRSIQFAINDDLGDRLYDLLICLREGMLNALLHGCEASPEKVAVLNMTFDPASSIIRVRIDDPGKGHTFDLAKRIAELERPEGHKLGLGIVQHLSDHFNIENKGASLVFDFHVKPDEDGN